MQLVLADVRGALNIPEAVTYEGRTYTVLSIGGITEDGMLGVQASIFPTSSSVTSITIPKTVRLIWDCALETPAQTLTGITVDAENPYFDSLDGVLFTEGLHTLILYPIANGATEYTVPDQTVFLAMGAFVQSPASTLTKLTLGASLRAAGVCHYGYGYPIRADGSYDFARTGEWSLLYYSMTGKRELLLSAQNTALSIRDGVLYGKEGTQLLCVLDRSRVSSVTVSASVQAVEALAFFGCQSLRSVYYEGSAAAWEAVIFGGQNDSLSAATVYFYSESAASGCWHYVNGVPTPW